MRRALCLLLLVAACSSGSSGHPKATCVTVPQAMLDGIASGAEKDVGTLKITKGEAVKSPDFKNVYFIAAHISAVGLKDAVGVWASNSLQPGGGQIMAVDGFAQQFTVWPDADHTSAKIGKADPSVDKAKGCV